MGSFTALNQITTKRRKKASFASSFNFILFPFIFLGGVKLN